MARFKSFANAAITIAGIELAHRIRKRQFSFGRGRRRRGWSRKDEWAPPTGRILCGNCGVRDSGEIKRWPVLGSGASRDISSSMKLSRAPSSFLCECHRCNRLNSLMVRCR
jgi:hypothetical protein